MGGARLAGLLKISEAVLRKIIGPVIVAAGFWRIAITLIKRFDKGKGVIIQWFYPPGIVYWVKSQ